MFHSFRLTGFSIFIPNGHFHSKYISLFEVYICLIIQWYNFDYDITEHENRHNFNYLRIWNLQCNYNFFKVKHGLPSIKDQLLASSKTPNKKAQIKTMTVQFSLSKMKHVYTTGIRDR